MVIERKARRQFDANFKLEVARMVKDQGLSVDDVCRSMDLGETGVGGWVQQYAAELGGEAGVDKPLAAEQQRIRQLEAENRQLRMDNDIFKKNLGLLCTGTEVTYRLVRQLQQKAIPVKQACRLLQASLSGYYQYRQRGERDLDMATTVHLEAAFWESGRLRQPSSNHCPESSGACYWSLSGTTFDARGGFAPRMETQVYSHH